jgi:hypothetical protein
LKWISGSQLRFLAIRYVFAGYDAMSMPFTLHVLCTEYFRPWRMLSASASGSLRRCKSAIARFANRQLQTTCVKWLNVTLSRRRQKHSLHLVQKRIGRRRWVFRAWHSLDALARYAGRRRLSGAADKRSVLLAVARINTIAKCFFSTSRRRLGERTVRNLCNKIFLARSRRQLLELGIERFWAEKYTNSKATYLHQKTSSHQQRQGINSMGYFVKGYTKANQK